MPIEDNYDSSFDTAWKKPPKVSELKADYEAALSSHSAHVSDVDAWRKLLSGDTGIKKVKGRSTIEPKLIRKQAEWRYAALSEPFLSTFNLFDAQPVTYEDKLAAEQNTLILNHQINNKINKVKFIDEYVRTAVDEGTVVVKISWKEETGIRKVEEPIMGLVPVQDPQIAQEMMMQGLQPVEEGIVDYKLVDQEVVIANHPTLDVCEYNNVIIDPTCKGDLDNAKFIIHTYTTSIDILKADGRYKNLELVNVTNSGPLSYADAAFRPENAQSFEFKDKARKKLVMHEYWGYRDVTGDGSLTPILACYIGDVLVRLEENPYPDKKLPFVVVSYLPVRKSIYGESDAVLIEDNQRIIGAVTRGMIDLMGRSANSQMGISKDALDVANKRKFEEGQDYMFNPNVNPQAAFYMHTYPEIPNSAMNIIMMNNNEAEAITGVKSFSQGITGNSLGDTATGVRSTLDATAKREMGILRRLADGIIQIGRKFISMNAEFLSEEEVVRVTNTEFVRVKRDDLNGSVDLRLTISTAEADNEKAQELAFMLQTIGNTLDPSISKMMLADIAKLRKMPELAKRIEEYQPQPDPMQQQMQMLQLQLLQAQVANEQAKGQENVVDAQLKMARVRDINAGADIKDLDFMEQLQGTKHQRNLEQTTNQSKNKIDEQAAAAMLEYQKEKAIGTAAE